MSAHPGILQQIARGRLFGQPIHMMLVHFPAALWPFGLLLDILARIMNEPSLSAAAFYCIAGGSVMGALAATFGAIDYFRLPPDHPAWSKASRHALMNVVWLMVFGTEAGIRASKFPAFGPASTVQILMSAAAVCGMGFSNHIGGQLVLKYVIGSGMESEG